MTDKVADDDYDDDEVIPWIASSKSSDQKETKCQWPFFITVQKNFRSCILSPKLA